MKEIEIWLWQKARIVVSRIKAVVDRRLAVLERPWLAERKHGNRR